MSINETNYGTGSLSNNTGINNSAFGYYSAYNNLDASNNTAVGADSLFYNTTGSNNTAVGAGSLCNNIGSLNTAVGSSALEGLVDQSIGNGNTAIGAQALYSNIGDYNTSIGTYAGFDVTNGNYNTFLGAKTGFDVSSNAWEKSTAIGYGATIDASNQIVLGRSTENVKIPGSYVGIGGVYDPTDSYTLDVSGNGYFSGILTCDTLSSNGSTGGETINCISNLNMSGYNLNGVYDLTCNSIKYKRTLGSTCFSIDAYNVVDESTNVIGLNGSDGGGVGINKNTCEIGYGLDVQGGINGAIITNNGNVNMGSGQLTCGPLVMTGTFNMASYNPRSFSFNAKIETTYDVISGNYTNKLVLYYPDGTKINNGQVIRLYDYLLPVSVAGGWFSIYTKQIVGGNLDPTRYYRVSAYGAVDPIYHLNRNPAFVGPFILAEYYQNSDNVWVEGNSDLSNDNVLNYTYSEQFNGNDLYGMVISGGGFTGSHVRIAPNGGGNNGTNVTIQSFDTIYSKYAPLLLNEWGGTVYIGKNNTYNELYAFDVSGNVIISGTCSAASFITTSDYRLKTNIEPLLPSRSIDDLKPVEYDLSGNLQHDMGFIAHEVQEIFPFLVHGAKDGEAMQSLNYTGFISLLVKEVQDLKKENKMFKERLEKLENKLNKGIN